VERGVRVLIADDERTFARTLAEMVRCGGHEVVDVVHCGLDAIRSYRQHKPEVVLMDFRMTKLNGLTACRNILSDDPKGRIVFLSANAECEQLAPRSSGAISVLQKPIGLATLEQALHDVVEEPRALLAS
jgi:CheY-like chemotaxis protein